MVFLSRVKCLSSHSLCIHLIICTWECPCKCMCACEQVSCCVSLDGSPIHVQPSVHLPTWLYKGVSTFASLPVPLSVYLLLLVSVIACVCSGVSLWVSPSPHTSAPRLHVRILAVDASCVLYVHPVSTVHGTYGTCEHTYLGVPVSVFMSVCVFGQHKQILSILCPGGFYLCVHLHSILCPHVSKLHVCRFIFVEPCVCDGAAVSC